MKIIGWIVAILIASLVGVFFYVKSIWDNITFKIELDKSKISLQSILSQLLFGGTINVPVKATVDNNNNVSIRVRDLSVKVSYQGVDVLQTKKDSSVLKTIIIPANSTNYQLADDVQLFANSTTIKLINELTKNSKPEVDITVSGKIFFIKIQRTFKQTLEF